ncbi:MAG: hypothetical protein IKU16_00335 [Muribaculaceae bacterium]|nr:hypothetical protein [Muribaculaceae bacterium]
MKKFAKIFMMATLVLGVASCNDQDDAPVMPNNPSDNQEEVDKDPINIAKMMKEEASGYDNITFIDNTTETEMDGGWVPLNVDFSSFKDYATIIILEDLGIKYEIYIPEEGAKLNLKFRNKEGICLGVSEFLYLNKRNVQIPFKKELLGYRCDCDEEKHKHGEWESDYYYRAENDYVTCLYDSPQLVELEILPNKSGKEQTLEFSFTDYKPLYGAGFCVVQAAK